MLIAVEGCCHGELDKIYDSLLAAERKSGRKIDLLLICGDFQSMRNERDLTSLACPQKYRAMGDFHKYFSGKKKAPILTIFIGGNHEASNYLWELYYGGWAAENIYFLGFSGAVWYNGLLITGMSGIYKSNDFEKGYHERPPYSPDTMRSIYHVREFEVMKLISWGKRPTIGLSHDWPLGIHNYGDTPHLLRRKKFFREDIENGQLGSPPAMEVLRALRPDYWFSAHLHVKFAALVDWTKEPEAGEGCTKFLALDKCLPRRDFLQVVEVTPPEGAVCDNQLRFDPDWLAVVRASHRYFPTANKRHNAAEYPLDTEKFKEQVAASREFLDRRAKTGHNGKYKDFVIPPWSRDMQASAEGESWVRTDNPQTNALCAFLDIPNVIRWGDDAMKAAKIHEAAPRMGSIAAVSVAETKSQLTEIGDGISSAKKLLDSLLTPS
eukprot:Sspe_Gene.38342::Locus_18478_Transcript_1_1_Confidence_1.000_Length_1463::g.38342::m.38342/K18328/DBR1; lariat debranching enzyme